MAAPLAVFRHDGNAINYTPTVDVPAGSVIVQGLLLGITVRPIKANEKGSLAVVGVFRMKKVNEAVPVGTPLYWDATAQQATMTAGTAPGNTPLGMSVQAAANTDETVDVRIG